MWRNQNEVIWEIKKSHRWLFFGLLDFFVGGVLFAFFAVFGHFQFGFQSFFVAARIVVHRTAVFALQFDHVILRHNILVYLLILLEPAEGLEPTTYGLQNRCSTN